MTRHSISAALFLLFALGIAGALPQHLSAQTPLGRTLGFGIGVGEPTGLTMRSRTGATNAIEIGLGASYVGRIRLHGMYIWQPTNMIWFTGVGFLVGADQKEGLLFGHPTSMTAHDFVVAGRLALGLNWYPRYTPLEFYLETDPLFLVSPKPMLGLEVSIGMRIYP